MKTLPAGLQAKIASGVTTLCRCWRVTPIGGIALGFTDHDRDLAFDGTTFKADTGLSGSAWAARLGLAVDTQDVHGALSDAALDEDDLARGKWDNAAIELWHVDWSTVADRVLMFSGSIGDIQRGPLAFRAELRSLAHALNQPTGRIFGTHCDADLGDVRCSIDLGDPNYSASGSVASVIAARAIVRTGDLGDYSAGWFKAGRLTWTSGANAGASMEVKRHTLLDGDAVLELVGDMPFDIEAGDTFDVTAGCDKTKETCKNKFGNVINFRGFPHMPGNDWITSYPNRGDGNDGGKL